MSTPNRAPDRPIVVRTLDRQPLPRIPQQVFQEPKYVDGKPYEDTAGGPGPDEGGQGDAG